MILLENLKDDIAYQIMGYVVSVLVTVLILLVGYIWTQQKKSNTEKKIAQLKFNEGIQKEVREVGLKISESKHFLTDIRSEIRLIFNLMKNYDKRIEMLESDFKHLKKNK